MPPTRTPEHFWSRVSRGEPDECWLWNGALANGYGSLKFNRTSTKAHRVAWELTNGPIPDGGGWHGVVVMHSCDNRRCCNPAHLSLGTQGDNIADMSAKGRRVFVIEGYKPGSEHPMARLTEEDVRQIHILRRIKKLPRAEVAERYGVSKDTVSQILNGSRWHQVWEDMNQGRLSWEL